MTAREQAIEAAMVQNWWRLDGADQIRPVVTGVLAAARLVRAAAEGWGTNG